ncbi:hypothetical protein ANCCAN_28466, partial [Ancylostoma caninum]
MEIRGPSLWESPPCTGVCFKWNDYDLMYEQTLKYCKVLLEDVEMLTMLNESKFELAYVESFDSCAPGIFQVKFRIVGGSNFLLLQILGIKNMVMVSAFGMLPRMYEIVGMVELPSFMPESYTPYSDDMTFLERLTNFRVYIKLMLHMRHWDSVFWEVFNAKYPGFPAIKEIYNEKTCLIMANVNEFAETPRPKTNMIRYIGGSTLYDAKPLTKVCTTEYSRSAAVV